jgi:hypothetical protein
MDIDVKDWLLEEEDPSVRFFTLTRLLGEAVDSPGARAARLRIADSGPAAAILKGQAEGGYWETRNDSTPISIPVPSGSS